MNRRVVVLASVVYFFGIKIWSLFLIALIEVFVEAPFLFLEKSDYREQEIAPK